MCVKEGDSACVCASVCERHVGRAKKKGKIESSDSEFDKIELNWTGSVQGGGDA